jgi:hypothetical protein
MSQHDIRKDSYKTDVERDVWQKGYNCFEAIQGQPATTKIGKAVVSSGSIGIHPLSMELMGGLYGELPEHLHDALTDGWWCAFNDHLKKASS